MKKIIETNYESTVKRGLINDSTDIDDFIEKLFEEALEFKYSYAGASFREELADVILVCLNIARHYEVDIESELKKKIEINYKRAENGKG